MISEEKINPNDLVLKFKSDVDISKYYNFIDVLCRNREYQKDAIIRSVKFFLDNKVKNTEELMVENFAKREEIRSFFQTKEDYIKDVQLRNKKSVTLDLATGTGKTWVMYGVAQILLCEGIVDQVLVLCPSVTIKNQLIKRFREFSEDENLKKTLPVGSVIKNPEIHDAQQTIKRGDLCVHNIHAIYERVSSSISDSLRSTKKGERTLVINDEAHHYLNKTDEDMKLWGEFLENENFRFKYILNVTGTPYKGNVYFKNVISRFSIKEAIDQKFIKDILYITETSKNLSEFEKFDLIYKHHLENRRKYKEVKKVISLFVTSTIAEANRLEQKFKKFLLKQEYMKKEEADKKVITVTSSPDHEDNVLLLDTIDSVENPVEWIISVSMLTEGWDVKKVFQIIPHEKRAFDSKLLISQVLGRGLRIPLEYQGKDELPQLIIANHDNWSKEIEDYVYAVSEIKRITSKVLELKNKFNFEVEILSSEKKEVTSKRIIKQEKEIKLPEIPDLEPENVVSERLKSLRTSQIQTISTIIDSESYDPSERIAQRVYNEIWLIDQQQQTNYLKQIDKGKLDEIIIKKCSQFAVNPRKIDYRNKQRILKSFEVLKRKGVGSTQINLVYSDPIIISTTKLPESKISEPQLKETSVFRGIFFDNFYSKSDNETKDCIKNLEKERLHLRVGTINKIDSEHEFKTPQNIIICDSENEIKFVEHLINKNKNIISWIKNNAYSNFYAIPFDFRDGSHTKNLNFNPDFIIKNKKLISIVEIKFGGDISDINKAKRKGANKYISELNKKSKTKYILNFLSPRDYDSYFTNIIERANVDWKSQMDKQLEV